MPEQTTTTAETTATTETGTTRLAGAASTAESGATQQAAATTETTTTSTQTAGDRPLVDSNLDFLPGWTDKLGGEFQQYAKTAAKFTNVGGMVKSFAGLEKLRGVPSEGADPEAIAAYRQTNSIPESAEAFAKAVKVPGLEEGQSIDSNIMALASEAALKANMTPEQLGVMLAAQTQMAGQLGEQQKAADAAALDAQFEALETKWGPAKKELQYANARESANMLGLDINDPAIGENPVLIEKLADLHSKLDEDTLKGLSNAGPTNGESTGQAARSQAKDIATNTGHDLFNAYHNPSDPKHEHAVAEYNRFNNAAHGV